LIELNQYSWYSKWDFGLDLDKIVKVEEELCESIQQFKLIEFVLIPPSSRNRIWW
jgi:hypothetical protein